MGQPMVVTNVRMPQSDYRQIKSIAGELGISVNEYIHTTAKNAVKKRQANKDKKINNFYEAMEALIHTPTKGKPMGLSKEDEIIYAT